MVGLLRAIQYARDLDIRVVVVPRGFGYIDRDIEMERVRIVADVHSRTLKRCFASTFLFPSNLENRRSFRYTDLDAPQELRRYFHTVFNVTALGPGDLVMHCRGSDVFIDRPPRSYGQPPCPFYRQVLRRYGKSGQALLISSDEANPCVRLLAAEKGLRVLVGRRFEDDMRVLLGARVLAIGRGTFGVLVACLSLNVDVLYTFNMSSSRVPVPRHYNCIPSDRYFNDVLRCWRRTPRQLALMETEACAAWEQVVYGDKLKIYRYLFEDFL